MSIKNIITKMLSGAEINALERAELEAYEPDKLTAELESLRLKVSEAEKAELNEKERLELDIAALSKERDELKISRDRLLRQQSVRELAGRTNFSDPEYLDYLASKDGVDLNDADLCEKFIEKIRREKPHSFGASVKSGSGISATNGTSEKAPQADVNRIGKIISGLENISYI